MRGPLSCLNEARYGILWGAVGAGARVLRVPPSTTPRARVQFGVPIGSFQLTQRKLVEMMVRIEQGATSSRSTSAA